MELKEIDEIKTDDRIIAICDGNRYSKGDTGRVDSIGLIECEVYLTIKLDRGGYAGPVLADSFRKI